MNEETKTEIRQMTRTGFYTQAELLEIFCEEMYAPGELNEAEVKARIYEEYVKFKEEQKTWPAVTDVDKLKTAFAELNKQGVIALHNAGYTQSDGYEDVMDYYHDHKNSRQLIGYCYYHGQDLARAVNGDGLLLSFGPLDAQKEETDGPKIGKLVVEQLTGQGFEISWDGTFNQRIQITKFDWKHRG